MLLRVLWWPGDVEPGRSSFDALDVLLSVRPRTWPGLRGAITGDVVRELTVCPKNALVGAFTRLRCRKWLMISR